jgi:hypothetical protein
MVVIPYFNSKCGPQKGKQSSLAVVPVTVVPLAELFSFGCQRINLLLDSTRRFEFIDQLKVDTFSRLCSGNGFLDGTGSTQIGQGLFECRDIIPNWYADDAN